MTIAVQLDVDAMADAHADGTLLAEVAAGGSGECFEQLVGRHAHMVLGVCRRQLGNGHDAEDAAQAVFLVLWKKAGSLRGRASVAGWLHHVARNVCRNAKRAKSVRQAREREAAKMNQKIETPAESWDEIKEVLDDELDRLPEKYRLPIILSDMEGQSQEEIATLLETNRATIATRIRRGREMLRSRLARRGVTIGISALAASLTTNACTAALPVTFTSTTTQAAMLYAGGKLAAGGLLSAKTAALAEGTLKMLTIAKMKMAAAVIVTATVVTGGSVAVVQQVAQGESAPTVAATSPNLTLRDSGGFIGLVFQFTCQKNRNWEATYWVDDVVNTEKRTPKGSLGPKNIEELNKLLEPFASGKVKTDASIADANGRFTLEDAAFIEIMLNGRKTIVKRDQPDAVRLRDHLKRLAQQVGPGEAADAAATVGIAWGEPRRGVRVGLSPANAGIAEGAKFVEVDVWFKNVGKQPTKVPVHYDDNVNFSSLMFSGQHDDKPIYVTYLIVRAALGTGKQKTLKPGETFSERFTLQVAKRGSAIGYTGLPALAKGESLTLQAGWCEDIDPHREKDWEAQNTLKSGEIKVTATKDPTAERLAELKRNLDSFRLRLQYYYDTKAMPMPGLLLHVADRKDKRLPKWHAARLTREQAEKLLDGLAADGLLRHVKDGEAKFGKAGYVLHLGSNRSASYEILGEPRYIRVLRKPPESGLRPFEIVGAYGTGRLRQRLTTLHGLLHGEAAEALDSFLSQLTK
jgi:RNA polymerase sigma factor (sigma-70 family)